MDKTDKVLKQLSKSEPMKVTPIGSEIIIPNKSGVSKNIGIGTDHPIDNNPLFTGIDITGKGGTSTKSIIRCYNLDDGAGHAGAEVSLWSGGWGEWGLSVGDPELSTTKYIYAAGGYTIFRAGSTNGFGIKNNADNAYLLILNTSGDLSLTGSAPVASAKLELSSTSKGFLPPRMTTTQKNAISSPATGLVVYDTTLNKLCVYTGAAWETITSV